MQDAQYPLAEQDAGGTNDPNAEINKKLREYFDGKYCGPGCQE